MTEEKFYEERVQYEQRIIEAEMESVKLRRQMESIAQAYRDLAALQRTQKQTMAVMVRACIQRLRSPDSRKRAEAIDALASLADMLEKEGN